MSSFPTDYGKSPGSMKLGGISVKMDLAMEH